MLDLGMYRAWVGHNARGKERVGARFWRIPALVWHRYWAKRLRRHVYPHEGGG